MVSPKVLCGHSPQTIQTQELYLHGFNWFTVLTTQSILYVENMYVPQSQIQQRIAKGFSNRIKINKALFSHFKESPTSLKKRSENSSIAFPLFLLLHSSIDL